MLVLIGSYRKKVIGLRLIDVSHSGDNIADRIASVVEEFGLIDKVLLVSAAAAVLLVLLVDRRRRRREDER